MPTAADIGPANLGPARVERERNNGPLERVQFIDATRGAAMFLVFVAHFADIFFLQTKAVVPVLMRAAGMVASPTFAMLNGLLIGFLYRTAPERFDRLRIKLVDRGLFLLTIGHIVIVGAHRAISPSAHWLF